MAPSVDDDAAGGQLVPVDVAQWLIVVCVVLLRRELYSACYAG
jgi:hypothetical protein